MFYLLFRLFEFRKIISQRETCFKLIPQDYPVEITKNNKYSDCSVLEGKFMSPLELHLPGVVPKAAQEAHFQVILPKKWKEEKFKPMCIHLAGTGDHVCIVSVSLRSVCLYKVLFALINLQLLTEITVIKQNNPIHIFYTFILIKYMI